MRSTSDYSLLMGSYFTVDGIDFHWSTATGAISLGDWDGSPGVAYVCLRNCQIRGAGLVKGSNQANAISGADHLVIYNTAIFDNGLWTEDQTDIDCHGLAGFDGADVWVLDCDIYNNQGDGIQINAGAPGGANTIVQRVYVGRCRFWENRQTGCWIKNGQDIIISESEAWGHVAGNFSTGAGMGGQYGFHRAWWINNYIHDNDIGFGIASGYPDSGDIYFIGNVIDTILESVYVWGEWENVFFYNNSFYNYTSGIYTSPNSLLNIRVDNNIFWQRNSGTDYDIETGSTASPEKIRNNLFPSSPRFLVDGGATTSISAMEGNDPTNRHDNQAGADPQFNNPTGGDFTLGSSSPAIDAGAIYDDVYDTFQTLYGLDIRLDRADVTRPQNAVWDIGAYERV